MAHAYAAVNARNVASNSSEEEPLLARFICQFELPSASLKAVGLLYDIFQHIDIEALFSLLHNTPLTAQSSGPELDRFVLTHSQSTQSMCWLNTGTSYTLDAFSNILAPEVKARLARVAGGPIEINAACYIIVRHGVADKECMPHYDFFSQEIHCGSAFTLMTPMSADHPLCVGGLGSWAWAGLDRALKSSDAAYKRDVKNLPVRVTPYRYGSATAIDGRLLDHAQPYRLDAAREVDTTELLPNGQSSMRVAADISSGALRVLLPVYASRATVESWLHIERFLLRQVSSGHVQGNKGSELQHSETEPQDSDTGMANAPKAPVGTVAMSRRKEGLLLRKLPK